MYWRRSCSLAAIVLMGMIALGVPQAMATGTASGTNIQNSATVDYDVSSVAQTQVTSNTASFLVDNKVDLTVATTDGALVTVVPGATAQVLTYTVTNDGNTVQDYSLTATHSATGAFGGTESFDVTGVNIYVDANSNDSYDTGTDTGTYIDELAADASISVFIVANVPLAQVDDDVSSLDLVAQTAVGGSAASQGADITTDDAASADVAGTVQIVFADGAGTNDNANDGKHSSLDGYEVVTATITATKASAVDQDPVNGGTNPKAIPGATMGYTVDINNGGSAQADDVIFIDSIPANTNFLVASVSTTPASGPTVAYSDDNGTSWTFTPVADGDGSDSDVTDVRVTFTSIAAAGTAQVVFQVLIE